MVKVGAPLKIGALAVLAVAGLGCSGTESADDSGESFVAGNGTTTLTNRSLPASPDSGPPATTKSTTSSSMTSSSSSTTSTSTTSMPVETVQRETDPALLAGARVLCTFSGGVVPESVISRIRTGEAAGVLLFRDNLGSREQAVANVEAIQAAAAALPTDGAAFIAADQEGGIVKRIPGPPTGSAAEMGTLPVGEIHAEGQATADNLRSWGINLDLAPVADVARAGGFVEAQRRSFSMNPEVAADSVAAFVDGLRAGEVLSTLKHFPGLGAAVVNTDDSGTVIGIPAEELTSVDLVPFAAGIEAGADLVMMSSAVYTSYDSLPAVLSPIIVRDVLRGELGFTGVVVSDALDTPALSSFGSTGEIAVTAASAGVDLFIGSDTSTCERVHTALTEALEDGTLSLESGQDAYERIQQIRKTISGD